MGKIELQGTASQKNSRTRWFHIQKPNGINLKKQFWNIGNEVKLLNSFYETEC